MRRRLLRAALAAAWLLPPRPAAAVETRFWEVRGYRGFLAGELQGVSLRREGDLLLAPDLLSIPLGEGPSSPPPFLWDAALDRRGNLYLGSGPHGVVYKVDPEGTTTRFFAAPAIDVHALAIDSRDRLLVGASPPARVYRVSPDGRVESWFEPEERYVWDLLVDRDDDVLVATGERGVLFRVSPDGDAEELFDADEPHLVSLALDPTRAVIAGGAGRGLVYRIDREGRAGVLLDAGAEEVAAIAVLPSGAVYAGVNTVIPPDRKEREEERRREPKETLAGELPEAPTPAPGGVDDLALGEPDLALGAAPRPEALRLRSAVYRLAAGAAPARIWESADEAVHCLVAAGPERVYFGTGVPGRLYLHDGDGGEPRLVARFPESQVTALAAGPGGLLQAVTSNRGRLYRASTDHGHSGTFLSPVRDAGGVARWGRVRWEADAPAGTRVEVATRSGNSSRPDATWSDWSPPYSPSEGAAVISPPARFLQIRARLSRLGDAPSPRLRSVSVSYREENLPPSVSDVRLDPAAGDAAAGAAPRARTIRWAASDPNGDRMAHDLLYRATAAEDGGWIPLAQAAAGTELSWDTGAIPDGSYRLQVRATDAPDNGAAAARTAIAVSEPFLIDHEPPQIQIVSSSVRDGVVRAALRVQDSLSPVVRVEVSVEGQPPRRLEPADGIDDDLEERYELILDSLGPGPHLLQLQALDREGNRRSLAWPVEVSR